MTAPFRFPRFFVTSPAPCPYLSGRVERKVFTELSGQDADSLNDALGRIGFRRSQSVAYRPSCVDCSACVSVRVCAGEFRARHSQKRTLRRITLKDAIEADQIFTVLMGEEVEPRREWIEQNAKDVVNLDI